MAEKRRVDTVKYALIVLSALSFALTTMVAYQTGGAWYSVVMIGVATIVFEALL